MISEEAIVAQIQSTIDEYKEAMEHNWTFQINWCNEHMNHIRSFVHALTGKYVRVKNWKVYLSEKECD